MSLTEDSTVGMIDRMVDLADVADLYEVRRDLAGDLDLLTLLRARTHPLLFTCRPVSQGGRWSDADLAGRRQVLREAVKRGFDWVDVEHTSGLYDVMAEKAGTGLVVSHHDLEATPADLDGLYAAMVEQGADVVKIAVTPRSVADVGRLLDFAARTARSGSRPLVALAMGPLGLLTRILGGRYGAPFTYAAAGSGVEAAPGQLPAAALHAVYRVRSLTPATRVYGILGGDVSRSLSPAIHNAAFAARGVDAVYVPLQAEALEPFLAALPAFSLSGFSVTRPYKEAVVPHLHALDETAALCGSANTVVVRDGTLEGSSTDGTGVVAPLKRRTRLEGARVAIVGAGGAARSAALALVRKGAHVAVLARRPEQAEAVARAVGCAHAGLDRLESGGWDVLVNATPLGSAAFPGQSAVPASALRPDAVVFDMVYDPLETPLLREASAAGCTTVDGLEMLVAQAAPQFEAWTGLPAPEDVMREAALQAALERT